MALTVRDAVVGDGAAIRAVAHAGWRDTYAGLLSQRVIDGFLAVAYGSDMMQRRILRQTMLVAEEDGRVIAFANVIARADELELVAIYALPQARGRGAGTALLAALRSRFPGLPVVATVVDGNRIGEVFYERRGFVPGEPITDELLDEPITERTWRLAP